MKLNYIDLATKAQARKIYNWYNDSEISKYFKSPTRTMERVSQILSRENTYNYLINVGKKDIGYIFITKKENYCYLTILIDKKYWGKSYGKKAMKLIEDKAKALLINKIVLGLYEENKRAFNLYKGLGYIKTKKEKDVIVMEKKL